MSFDSHEKVARKYLSKAGLNFLEEINDQNSFWMIKAAYQDFRDEKLPFDDFSTLGEYLFNHLSTGMAKSLEFGSILLVIAELSESVRIWSAEDKLNNLTSSLIDIDNFFKSH